MIVDNIKPQVDRFVFPRCSPRHRAASGRPPSNGVATPTTAFIGGFRVLQKQLDEQVAKLHIRALQKREFMAIDSAHLEALDFKRNYGPAFLSRAT